MTRIVNVTRALRPSKIRYAIKIFMLLGTYWYTNDGKYVKTLESRLKKIWGVKNVVVMSNGTLPLQFLMGQLPKASVVATTPFTFISTASSIKTSGHEPFFVDLSKNEVNVNYEELEEAIRNQQINAILLTNVYGQMPNMKRLNRLKSDYKVPIYLDASHSFGVMYEGKSALSYGDAATISFHATKIFSTVEGGALITNDDALADEARKWRNFGFKDGEIQGLGVNAKMSELHALFGLELLPKIAKEVARRRSLMESYAKIFLNTRISLLESPNGSYAPVVFEAESDLISFQTRLAERGIHARRYFFPSLDTLEFLNNSKRVVCVNSRDLAERVLCLPVGRDVTKSKLRIINEIAQRSRHR